MFIDFLEIFTSNFLFFWLVVSILFLLLEMGSPGLFFFLAFFFGAVFAAIATFFTDVMLLQSIVFLFSSLFSFLLLHFWVKKHFSLSKDHEQTNVYALIGKQAKVVKMILPKEAGAVKVNGEIWSAKSNEEKAFLIGNVVEIIEVKGVHLIVKSID